MQKSRILVFLQYSLFVLLLLPIGEFTKYLYIGSFLFVLGVIVGVLAIQTQGLHNFNIRPDIKSNAKLITYGMYGHIRHPMYLSVILMALGIVVSYFSVFSASILVILIVVIIFKLSYEESLWISHDNNYIEYMRYSKKLIPYIF
jgi:protein-S-isoprenylcysteine O-methyltransferase Ste14